MVTNTFRAVFEIAEEINCPLYEKGERMELSDRTFSCPDGKEVCLILVRDMTQLLFGLLKEQAGDTQVAGKKYSCSGCTGLIRFLRIQEDRPVSSAGGGTERIEARIQATLQEMHGRTVESPFLKTLPENKIEPVIRAFREVDVPEGRTLVHQGKPNPNIYLIMAGSFTVENNRQKISSLGVGDLFGEMSYLGAGPAVTSIRALEHATVLAMGADDFSKLLSSSTGVQAFMARLLAERLQQINIMRVRDFENAMSGRIADVLPAELLQVFHMHQKTGVLTMELAAGKAHVVFREGGIVRAQYHGLQQAAAVYGILAEKEGYYRFTAGISPQEKSASEIGDFMAILMEGIRRVDEADPEYADDFSDD